MKKIRILGLGLLLTAVATAGKKLELKDVTNGTFYAQSMVMGKPMPDGDSYARLGKENRSIELYSFRTGRQTGVLFDADQVKGDSLEQLDNFLISPTGKRVLLQTATALSLFFDGSILRLLSRRPNPKTTLHERGAADTDLLA